MSLAVGDVGARMTLLRFADRKLMLHSPVRLDADLRRALDELGTVRWLVAPSKVHHLFLPEHVAAFPEAVLCGRAARSC